MPRLVIGSQVIEFPNSGTDANWAPKVIQFAQAVADTLAGIVSQFDIAPRVQILTSDANVNLDLTGASFPSGSVRSFIFTYGIYRTNGVTALAEAGTVTGVFNELSSTWELQHEFEGPVQSSGLPYHTFNMSGDQLQFSSVAIGGAYDTINSTISFSAKAQIT